MIMMEMTDFTRGKGRLQTTMAVIDAARKISEAGTKLDKLARQIADQCFRTYRMATFGRSLF
jgi:catenin alpha